LLVDSNRQTKGAHYGDHSVVSTHNRRHATGSRRAPTQPYPIDKAARPVWPGSRFYR
jgi:hypothetical protein